MSPYSERRGVSVATCVIALLIPAAVWWICLATDSLVFAWSVAGATAVAVGIFTTRRALEAITVTATGITVGPAHLETRWIGKTEQFSGAAWSDAIRRAGGHETWLSLRSFHSGGVVISNADPDDPIKLWVVSSRDSVALARALGQTETDHESRADRTSN